jgi:hypothetical protein
MNKNYKNVIAGIMLLAGAYFVYRYFKGAKKDSQPNKPLELSDFSTPPSPSTPSSFPLKKGSKGAKVLELQNAIMSINAKLLPKFGADGDFGSETELAVSRMLGKKTIDSQADIETIKRGKTSKARG